MTAQTGRPDYDHTSRIGTAAPGEPVFIVKGSDVVAGDTVRAWASLAAKAGTPAEVLELALQQADAMDRWGHKKKPLGPDLTENERLQLRVQHGRRAWQAREGVADTYPLLADKLAQDCISGILRPILAELLAGQTVDWDTCQISLRLQNLDKNAKNGRAAPSTAPAAIKNITATNLVGKACGRPRLVIYKAATDLVWVDRLDLKARCRATRIPSASMSVADSLLPSRRSALRRDEFRGRTSI